MAQARKRKTATRKSVAKKPATTAKKAKATRARKATSKPVKKQVEVKSGVLEALKQPADHRTTGLVLGTGTGALLGGLLGGVAITASLGAGVGYLIGHFTRKKASRK